MENIEAAKKCEIVQGFMTDNEYNGYLIGVFDE